jgi:aminoglycoside phosphotransferase (APT) family kinase protein
VPKDITQLPMDSLLPYLKLHLPEIGTNISVTKFSGGQSNPTYKLSTEFGEFVLRRQPPGTLLKSAHAVDREYRVISALGNTDVPVPKVFHLCTDINVIGSMFYVMEYVDGRIFWDGAIPQAMDNGDRSAMYEEMNQVLANLHSVNLKQVNLQDYGRPGSYFERQLSRWTKQYRAAQTDDITDIDNLILWLEANLPEDDGKVSLVHGDFRIDNMIFHPTEPRIIAILDWELSTLGHPYADLAYQCMQLRLPASVGHVKGLLGVNRHALGIPSEEAYVTQYCEKMGIDSIPNWNFYLVFSFFRMLSIVQGVVKRALQGNASNNQALELKGMIKPLAELAVELID